MTTAARLQKDPRFVAAAGLRDAQTLLINQLRTLTTDFIKPLLGDISVRATATLPTGSLTCVSRLAESAFGSLDRHSSGGKRSTFALTAHAHDLNLQEAKLDSSPSMNEVPLSSPGLNDFLRLVVRMLEEVRCVLMSCRT